MKPITAQWPNGHLIIGGCAVEDLAKQFGTPLYVLDMATIRDRVRQYTAPFADYPHFRIAYASKALSITALYQRLAAEGLYFDVASDGELFTLLQADVSAQRAYFHGNNKTLNELLFALEQSIGCIVVDNESELDRLVLAHQTLSLQQPIPILIRVVPEIEAHTHEFIQTGQRDSKFGVHKEQLSALIARIKTLPAIHLKGLHAHIGSQIFDLTPYDVLIDRLMQWAMDIYQHHDVVFEEISIGGGVGVAYTDEDELPDVRAFVESSLMAMRRAVEKWHYPVKPMIVFEPGRSIVAQAGVTLYTIGHVKPIEGGRTYVSVDGGMADNPRPVTYGASYTADIAQKMTRQKTNPYTIAGRFCESGDILIRSTPLQEPDVGDVLVVYGTGAYNYSMSSQYNRVCRPAMVLVENGQAKLIVKRETLQDLIRYDVRLD